MALRTSDMVSGFFATRGSAKELLFAFNQPVVLPG
jgi:hypothetical protein